MVKKLFLALSIFIFLVGCSDEEEEDTSKASEPLQEQIENVMNENDFKYDDIVDFDIVDDYIFSVSLNNNGGLGLSIIKNNNGRMEWIAGSYSAHIIGNKGSPIVFLIQSQEPDTKQVNVFGEPAKSVTYYDVKTEDYAREIKYWITYTTKEPTPADVEYVKE